MKYLVLVALLAVATVAQDETEDPQPQEAAPDFGSGADAEDVLPTAEDCTGVTCDIEVIRNCDKPVLFAKQCCPVCPPADPCTNVSCSDGEVCTVHANTAICCTDLTKTEGNSAPKPGNTRNPKPGNSRNPKPGNSRDPKPGSGGGPKPGSGGGPKPGSGGGPKPGSGGGPKPGSGGGPKPGSGGGPKPGKGRRRNGRSAPNHDHAYSSGSVHLQRLPCRYDLPDNCTVRFTKQRPEGTTDACNDTCNSTELCSVRTVRRAFFFRVYRRKVKACCAIRRPECPIVPAPTVLGHCRLPTEPVPDHAANCSCRRGSLRLISGRPGYSKVILYGRGGRRIFITLRSTCTNAYNRVNKVMRLPDATRPGRRSLAICGCDCQTVEAFDGSPRRPRRCRLRPLGFINSKQCRRV